MRSFYWYIDSECHVLLDAGQRVVVPIIEFGKIGLDGDFSKPLTYTLEAITPRDRLSSLRGCDRISRNWLPRKLKEFYADFLDSGKEKLEGLPSVRVLLPAGWTELMKRLFRMRRAKRLPILKSVEEAWEEMLPAR
jgi:hypothetical protein